MSSSAKAAILVAVAFVAGIVIGVFGDRALLFRNGQLFPRHGSAFGPRNVAERLARELDLNDAQKRDVQRIVDQHHARIDAQWANVRPQVKREIDAANAEIEALLTPEQRAKFRDIRARVEQRRRHGPSRPF